MSEEIPKAFLHANRHEVEARMRRVQWKGHASWKREDLVRSGKSTNRDSDLLNA